MLQFSAFSLHYTFPDSLLINLHPLLSHSILKLKSFISQLAMRQPANNPIVNYSVYLQVLKAITQNTTELSCAYSIANLRLAIFQVIFV